MSSSSSVPNQGRDPSYNIQLIAIYHDKDIYLPTFCQNDLIWLLEPTLKGQSRYDATEVPLIGVALSTSEDCHPDVLTLSHKRRILMLQLPDLEEEEDDENDYPGMDLLKKLLLCTSSDDAESLDPLLGTEHAGSRLQMASLCASEIAYLLYNTFQVNTCLLDLDLLAPEMGYHKLPSFNHVQMINDVLGQKMYDTIFSLEPDYFLVKRESDVVENSFLLHLIGTLRGAIGSYFVSCKFTENCLKNFSNGKETLAQAKIDTRRIPDHFVAYLARSEAVEKALQLAKPKKGQGRLRKIHSTNGKQSGIEFGIAKKGNKIEVINEQYKYRLAPNSRQKLEISLTDKFGNRHTVRAKTLRSEPGRTSTLELEGKEGEVAMAMLRSGDATSRGNLTMNSIDYQGRDDHSAAEIEGMKWRRQMMSYKKKIHGRISEDCDPSGLLGPFLLGDKPVSNKELLENRTIRLMERLERDRYNKISLRESKNTLNPSQARAARAILSPLIDPMGKNTRSSSKEWNQEDRFCLVHGPPGTGKTSLITACCEQWQHSCTDMGSQQEYARDTIYACCQSNVAVKNIAESFSRSGINFKIIVSANFFVDWHEDLYADIKPRFLRSDELPDTISSLNKVLGNCNIVLSTVSFLSSPKITKGDCPLFKLRPMRMLFVDEASQIHLRAYPHLFERFGPKIARIVFLGDDRQLPPFQGEEVIDAGLSVFELAHIRKKAFLLDTCYRLAKPMAAFISENVYDGLLQCGERNYDPKGELLDCASFIDVESSKEEKSGTSRINQEEINVVVRLVKEYKKRGGAMSRLKVLTTYVAQRDALEDALKKANLSGDSDVVFSVDSFQGRESDYIILSLVKDGRPTIIEDTFRRKDMQHRQQMQVVKYLQSGLGFLSNDRRINVALTRAKNGIVVVSNRKFIIDIASETLVGKLQVEMQWIGEGGEMHWWNETDILNNRMPRALFSSLPERDDELHDLVEKMANTALETPLRPNWWD